MTLDIKELNSNSVEKRTRFSLLWSSLLNEIFISFFGLMPFILRKDLGASAFQISFFTMVKPAVAVFSFYWSSVLLRKNCSLRYNLVIASILARVPFLFFIFFDNVWYLIFASAVYMLFSRAAIPAWMEILKLNLQKENREKLFSLSSILAYMEGVALAIFIGLFLDNYQSGWKVFFMLSSFLGLVGVYVQSKTPISEVKKQETTPSLINLKELIKPWKEGMALIRQNPEFARFQIGTFCSGFGLMLIIPVLALFYADVLKLSHTEMTIGRYIFMGLGFVFLSPFWAKALRKHSINYLTGFVCIGFALFPALMLLALGNKFWIYIAFMCYGITQAGSHLFWHLSGPYFAKDEDSSSYSSINVLMVGVRGFIAPFLGGILCELFGLTFVFVLAISICLGGSVCMFYKKLFSYLQVIKKI